MSKLIKFILALLVVLSIHSPTMAEEKQPLTKVTFAQFGKEKFLLYLPLYIAMEEGIFKQNGLDVSLKFAGNDDQIFATVIGGSADFGVGDPVFAAIAKEKGGPGKIVALMITRLGLSGYTNNPNVPMIATPQDLNGLRLSSFPSPSTTYTLLAKMIADNKLDTKIVQAAFGAQLATLEAGKVDIAVDLEPTVSIAEDKGYRVVFEAEPYMEEQAITGISTSEKTIEDHPQTVQAVTDSLQQSINLMYSKPDIAIKVGTKIFPNLKPAVIEAAVERMTKKGVYSKSVVVSDGLWQNSLKTRLSSGELKKPQKTEVAVDNSFAAISAKKFSGDKMQ